MTLFTLLMHAIAEVEQNLIVGRAVDLLATHFKVHPPLRLTLEGETPLLLNSALGEQISDGASLILSSTETV